MSVRCHQVTVYTFFRLPGYLLKQFQVFTFTVLK